MYGKCSVSLFLLTSNTLSPLTTVLRTDDGSSLTGEVPRYLSWIDTLLVTANARLQDRIWRVSRERHEVLDRWLHSAVQGPGQGMARSLRPVCSASLARATC